MSYSFDNISLKKDNKRWFPVMGEMHYSRVPKKYWAEGLNKMKAGGVNITGTYVIWIHHEEIEGEWDWSGSRDLRAFIETAASCGMKILLRIGPWCHGEVRNGGFPDWLLHKDFEVRTNDPAYFEYAKSFYSHIFEQVKDYLSTPDEDKTIIGVQIENEYGHCGGLYNKEEGEEHMRKLLLLAKETGFNVPLYTATGWGGAWTGGMLPVMGGYCDAPWDPRITELEPSGNYTFTHERNDHNIGSDHGFGYGITFDMDKFPYLTAELGGGLQVTSHRRTVALPSDVSNEALVKMGSGVNLLGFYMYHGGTNPEGKLTTLQESKETGYLNDLPVKSYDFRAPVREFGQVSDTLKELKLLSYFVKDYGEELCSLKASIPQDNPLDPSDLSSLRYSFRTDGKKGYLFINNYVRHHKLARHPDTVIQGVDGSFSFKPMDIEENDSFFIPFNMTYGDVKYKAVYATPFMKAGNTDIFYLSAKNAPLSGVFDSEKQPESNFLVLKKEDALNLWKTSQDAVSVCNKDSYIIQNEEGKDVIYGRGCPEFWIYPDLPYSSAYFTKKGEKNFQAPLDLCPVMFNHYELNRIPSSKKGKVPFSQLSENRYHLNLSEAASLIKGDISDVFVTLNYTGESALLYELTPQGEKLLLDHFYQGEDYPWEIGLKRFIGTSVDLSRLILEIKSLEKDAQIYIEKWPEIKGKSVAHLHSAEFETEWSYKL